MKTNDQLTSEFIEIINSLSGDIQSRINVAEYMQNSTAIVHDQHIKSSFVPRFFNVVSFNAMKNCAEGMHKILCKVVQHYLDDPEYRSIFSFDKRLTDLILIPRRYESVLPFARVDTFMNESDYTFKFCEFNGDGSAGMNENREVTNAVVQSETFKEFSRRYDTETCELFNRWVGEFLKAYSTFENRVINPHIAICDYLDRGVVDEFKAFAGVFEQHGFECKVLDVRELKYNGKVLCDKTGWVVNAIWRRAVTNDVLEFWESSQALISAVREGHVALIGSFAGHLIHDKQINKALFHPKTHAFLTQEEIAFLKETVPFTAFLDSSEVNLEEICETKDKWIIKPTDAYGGSDVFAGRMLSQKEWTAVIDKFANSHMGAPFLVQTFIQPYKTEVLPYETVKHLLQVDAGNAQNEGISITEMYNNLNGLYLFNGKFSGVFSRLGPKSVITKPMGAVTSATVWVREKS